jgi:hypothetical protein
MADVPVPKFRKYWTQKLASLKLEWHATANKYPQAASIVQQVYRLLSDIENLTGYTPAKVGESSDWIIVVNIAEENRPNLWKALDGKPLFSVLYGMHTVTLNELQVSAQAEQNGAANETSLESRALDDVFQVVKRRKRHFSNDTSQTGREVE